MSKPHARLKRRSTGVRWSSWSTRVARPGSWLASTSAPRKPSAIGCGSVSATAAMRARIVLERQRVGLHIGGLRGAGADRPVAEDCGAD